MKKLLTMCQFPDEQTRCSKYKAKSETNKTCWRYRRELGHCNLVGLPTDKQTEKGED